MKKTLWERANKQQVTILALMFIPDCAAIALSSVTAYIFRFSDSKVNSKPSLAAFDYKLVLFAVAFVWSFILLLTGTYKFNITDFYKNYFVRKINEGFNYGERLQSYALQD
mgnify:CR=1 FL=1